jgi:hypothetical protein
MVESINNRIADVSAKREPALRIETPDIARAHPRSHPNPQVTLNSLKNLDVLALGLTAKC